MRKAHIFILPQSLHDVVQLKERSDFINARNGHFMVRTKRKTGHGSADIA